ncbi:MAG TPA: PAS domain S-box protein [Anaerolineales bacterium]|nr:PAS domain S-box protein [Anaerolineales bacterium]
MKKKATSNSRHRKDEKIPGGVDASKPLSQTDQENGIFYHDLYNLMEEGVAINEVVYDDDGNGVDYVILDVNPAFEQQSPYTVKEVLGRRATDLYQMTPESIREWWEKHSQMGQSAQTEMYHEPSKRWFFITSTAIHEDRFATIFTDITKRKQAELELLQNQQLIQRIADTVPNQLYIFDLVKGENVYINDRVEEFFGLTLAELQLKGQNYFSQLIHSDDLAKLNDFNVQWNQAEDGQVFKKEYRLRNANGEYRWLQSFEQVLNRNADGIPTQIIGTAVDVTEQKEARNALQENNNRFQSVWDATTDAMALSDPEGIVLMANRAYLNLYGFSAEQVVGHSFAIIFPKENRISAVEQYKAVFANDDVPVFYETIVQRADGSQRIVDSRVTFIMENGRRSAMLSNIRDITDRKRADEELWRNRGLLLMAQEIAQMGHWEWDIEHNQVTWSDQIYHIFGFDPNKVEADFNLWFDMIHLEDLPIARKFADEALQGADRLSAEYRIVKKDGSIRHLHVIGQHFGVGEGRDGQSGRMVGVVQDITERKTAQEKAAKAHLLLEKVERLAKIGGWELDVNTMEPYFSAEAFNIYGLPGPTPPKVEDGINFYAPESRPVIRLAVKNAIENHLPYDLELPFMNAKGKKKWVRTQGQAEVKDGRAVRLYGTLQDITERKTAEEMLLRNEQLLRLFVEYSPASIAMFDREMKYIVASKRYSIDYDLGDQFLIGRSHYDVFPEIPERWKEIHKRCLAGAVESAEEDPFPRQNGKLDWVRWEIHPWHEVNGEIGGILLFSEVITEQKLAEQTIKEYAAELERRVQERTAELNKLNIELQHANKAKDEFLATMSHELRTPLNSILGLSESLLEQRRDPLSERQQKYLGTIEASGHHLLELINDILDVSKIEAGKLDIYPDTIDVNALCRSSLAFVKEQALLKSISLNFDKDEIVSNIHADLRRMKQVLVNLLINAVKFTPKHGQVTLQVRADEEHDLVQFSVIDTGIGVTPEDLKRLFKPFVQVDSSLSRQNEGTGLGLALAQRIIDLHGGSIQVQSEPGKGSTFTVNLPWSRYVSKEQEDIKFSETQMTDTKSETSMDEPLEGRIALLVEDNLSTILTVSGYLESYGCQVLVAHNGLEAIDLAEKNDPEIILMDIQMPVMDGFEAIKKLRMESRFASTPIIALTALAMPGDRERCFEAGANEYLSKPVSLKGLVKTMNFLLDNK